MADEAEVTTENVASADAGANSAAVGTAVDATGGKNPERKTAQELSDANSGAATDTVEGAEADDAAEPDWRAQAAGEDKDLKKLVGRYGSINGMARALMEAKRTISKGASAYSDTLPDDATDEQKAEWRKARGVPDSPDKYDLKLEGFEWGEADQKDVQSFAERMHAKHVPAGVVKEALQHFADVQTARAQEQAVAASQYRDQTIKALKQEMGRDFERNVKLMESFGHERLGEDQWSAFMNTPLADGTLLGDRREMITLLVETALERGDGLPFESGGATGGVSDADLIEAHKALASKAQGSGPEAREAREKMNNPEYDAKIKAVYERQLRRAGKKAA